MGSVNNLVKYGCVKSASIVGAGGIAATISEMAFGNGIGFSFDSKFIENCNNLFVPQYTSMILELDVIPKDTDSLRSEFILLGSTTDKKCIEINGAEILLDEAQKAWESALGSVFPVNDLLPVGESVQAKTVFSAPSAKKRPKVLIPIFPGTTGEYELEKQFINAGAEVKSIVFCTGSADEINESYIKLTEAINDTDILALPSGMSAGAEPDGSAKLISIILRHPDVKNAVNNLVSERKGLILGLGESFKALQKTGLIQTGQICDDECEDVILTRNQLNKHHCAFYEIEYMHSNSPWLKGMSGTTEIVPISGMETDVHMSDETFKVYMDRKQIVSMKQGDRSSASIEAMISENGLILGRTALVENLKKGLYTNIFEAKESQIFKNAVDYVKKWR